MVEISAADEKNFAVVVHHIKKGSLANVQQIASETGMNLAEAMDFTGMTPLHHATISGNVDIIQYIVTTFGGLDARDSLGRTPFHLAAQSKKVPVLEKLAQLDESETAIDLQSNGGLTPLMYAVKTGDFAMVAAVLNCKANPFYRDSFGREALQQVLKEGDGAKISAMIEQA